MNVWCVDPEDKTIDLVYVDASGAEHALWIRVKKELNYGEERKVMTAGWRGMSNTAKPGEPSIAEIQIDWRAQTLARTEAYLLDWSLTKDKIPCTREGFESLRKEVYAVVENALTAHIEAMELEKKAASGSNVQSAKSA